MGDDSNTAGPDDGQSTRDPSRVEPRSTRATFMGKTWIAGDAVTGDKYVLQESPYRVPPHQLPRDLADFTGRDVILGQLDALVPGEDEMIVDHAIMPVVVIFGMAGVGKTALAVHWAHRLVKRFRDGQLFIDLRGHSSQSALTPREALAQLLRALGMSSATLPSDEAEQAALYRSLVAEKDLLIVLDNAQSSEQIRMLLPGSRRCLAVATSRNRLIGLVAQTSAHLVGVDLLSAGDSLALLTSIIGSERVSAELSDAKRLTHQCAYLPLAIRIVGAQLVAEPTASIGTAVGRLKGSRRLAELTLDDDPFWAIPQTFDLSYHHLAEPVQRTFRRLALVPGVDFTPEGTAALLDIDVAEAEGVLAKLERASLIEMRQPRRYRLHDLLRDYAWRRTHIEDSESDREMSIRRLLVAYLKAAYRTGVGISPYRNRLCFESTIRASWREHGSGATNEATDRRPRWSEIERANLVAAVRLAYQVGENQLTWELADALFDFLEFRHYSQDNEEVQQFGALAARRVGNRGAEACMEHNLAMIECGLDNYRTALQHAVRAYEIKRDLGDRGAEASVLNTLSQVYRRLGQYAEALECANSAYRSWCELDGLHGQALALGNMARVLRREGDPLEARQHAQESLRVFQNIHDGRAVSDSLEVLVRIHCQTGNIDEALSCAVSALEIREELGDLRGQGDALRALAGVYFDLADDETALIYAQRALMMARTIGDIRGKGLSERSVSQILLRMGHGQEALWHAEAALATCREAEDPHGYAARRRDVDAIRLGLEEGEVLASSPNEQQSNATNAPDPG